VAKKTADKKDILSLEDEFMKVMGGVDDIEDEAENDEGEEIDLTSLVQESALKTVSTPAKSSASQSNSGKSFSQYNLKLSCSPDGMIALLVGSKAHSFSTDIIVSCLKKEGITKGIIHDSISQIVSNLKQEGSWTGKIIVARGKLPVPEEGLSFPFIAPVDRFGANKRWSVDGQSLSFDGLLEISRNQELPTENAVLNTKVRPVKPGEVVAIVEEHKAPSPGYDIFGKIVDFKGPELEPGENVKKSIKGDQYEATIFGYLCIKNNELSVISPIKVTTDGMAAYFVNCPPHVVPITPSLEDFKISLKNIGVVEDAIAPVLIEKLCVALKENRVPKPLIKIASGSAPFDGRDAKIVLAIDTEKKAGEVKADDTIDLRERNMVSSVFEGDLLAVKFLPTIGEPGFTVLGDKIPQKEGKKVDLSVIGPVLKKESGGRIDFFAKICGNVGFSNNVLTLTDVFVVNGDVDYSTGNIEVVTGLSVTESVLPGFKVSADGNAIIGGTIENGAQVVVKGNLKVEKGIIGADTKVVVMGSLQAGFVQDAEIMVKGDVVIGSYSFNGIIRSGGEVIIKDPSSQAGGKVVGGVVCATKGISMSTLGSAANTNTMVAIQRDIELSSTLKKAKVEIQDCTETIMKIMRSLNLSSVDMGLMKKLIEKTPSPKKEMLVKLLVNMNNLIKKRSELYTKEKKVDRKINELLEHAHIKINKEAYLGNRVRIGEDQVVLEKDMVGPTVFRLENETILMK